MGPMVSVIMPAYNAEEFVEQAIRSALAQTYTNLEVIVINDVSKDATQSIAERLAREDSRVRLLNNEKNLGAAGSRNRGMDAAEGEYVALLDSDDYWHPEKLEIQMELAQKEKADLVYSSYEIVDEKGNKKCSNFIAPKTVTYRSTLSKCEIGCLTAVMGPEVIHNYRFSSEFYHEDLVMWLQILRDGKKAVGTQKVLAAYRVRENSRAANKVNAAKWRWEIYRRAEGLSLFASAYYFVRYALAGIRKYRPMNEQEANDFA